MTAHQQVSIAFRAAATAKIGGGHITRCLSLAQEFAKSGAHCSFLVNPEAAAIVPSLATSGFQVLVAPSDSQLFAAFVKSQELPHFQWIFVDNYSLDWRDEEPMRQIASNVFVVDDLANRRHDCDLLLDSVPRRSAKDYLDLVPAHAKLLLGQSFVPLRGEFAQMRERALRRRQGEQPPKRLLVSFGLSDPGGITAAAVANLAPRFPELEFDVVLGLRAPSLSAVEDFARRYANIAIHRNPRSVSKLMLDADVALGAGGSTGSERACLGLPSLTLLLADNQRELGLDFAARGAAYVFEPTDSVWELVSSSIRRLQADFNLRLEMSANAARVCDGLGARRVWQALQNYQEGNYKNEPDTEREL